MVYLLKMVIFYSYAKLPEGIGFPPGKHLCGNPVEHVLFDPENHENLDITLDKYQ